MKLLIVLSAFFLAFVQVSHAQTQAAVMLSTSTQVNASLLQVNLIVTSQKNALGGITEIDVKMVGNVYDSIFAAETDAVDLYLTPLFTGTLNTSVIALAYAMEKVVNPTRALLLQVRDTAFTIKRNNLVRIASKIDFWAKDVSAFLNGLSTYVVDKFTAKTIIVSKVAGCQKTAFTAFNVTLAQASAQMTTCAKNFMTNSKSGYSSIQNYYAGVANIFDSVVLNIQNCLSSNTIPDIWAIDWVTESQRTKFIACVDKAAKAAATRLSSGVNNTIINGLTKKLTADSTTFFNCMETMYQTTISKLMPVNQAYSKCF